MNNLNQIIKCEHEYIKYFCDVDEQQDFIRFYDDLITDMWYHNYTWIKKSENDTALFHLIESEVSHSRDTGKEFCLLRCHTPVKHLPLAQLSCKPDISTAGYYVLNTSNLPKLAHAKDSCVIKVDKAEMLEDMLELDLEHDEESLGRDFCTRRIYRRKDIYLSDKGVDSYVCYYDSKAVGNCDLFIHNGIAKIEDFAISPSNQRRGFGTTLLKTLIETALDKNATIIYLEADEDDTVKEMYQKCGFHKVYEFTDLAFNF